MVQKNITDSLANDVSSDGAVISSMLSEQPAEKLGIKLVTILACIHLLIAAGVIINNLSHPAIIDSAESMHAFLAYEAGSGMRLYGPINPFVLALWYTPLAFQITGVVSSWFGYDIRVMRLIVALFFWATVMFLGMTVYRMTRNKYLALIGAGLFGGLNAGPWYYMLSPNGLHVLFAVLAVYLLIRDSSLRWPTVFAVILALFASFWSKQTGLAYLAAGLLYFWIKDWRKGIVASIFAFLLIAGFAGYYINQPESSFLSMLFMHKNHPIMWKWIFNPVLFPEMLGRYGIMFAVVIAGIIGLGWKWDNWIKPEYVFLGAGAVVGLSCSIKYGSGFDSQGIFFCGMLIVCGMYFLNKFSREKKISLPLMLGLLIVQSVVLFLHGYSSMIITSEDDVRFRKILDIMATPGKNVHYITQPFHNVLAGTKPYPSVGRDCWHNGVYDRSCYPESLRKFYEKDPFDIIIIDLPLEDNSWMLYERINANYVPTMEIPPLDPRQPSPNTLRNKKIVFYRKNLVGPRAQ